MNEKLSTSLAPAIFAVIVPVSLLPAVAAGSFPLQTARPRV